MRAGELEPLGAEIHRVRMPAENIGQVQLMLEGQQCRVVQQARQRRL